jgi:hypothetical protein
MTFVLDIFHNLEFLETTFWKIDPFVSSDVRKEMFLLIWACLKELLICPRILNVEYFYMPGFYSLDLFFNSFWYFLNILN